MSSSSRNRGRKDRFYSPPAMRRHNQQQVKPPKHEEKKKQIAMTNLDLFMKHTTPVVTAQHFPKREAYFILGDLWESFKEWSAYGVGVPLVLNEGDSVVQYYAPSLSAIQLYVHPSTPTTTLRRAGEDSEYESSCSDGSYEAVTGEGEIRNHPGHLIFEYFERASPFHREPLTNKILDLELKFPALRTYRSCDLTQSSWFSVAWYPIYRIPVGPSLQNVDTSFLTFHSLSTSTDTNWVREAITPRQLSLPIFGLAVYKFKNSDWTKDGVHGSEKIKSLVNSTENWLTNLDVHHPDYVFFKNHY